MKTRKERQTTALWGTTGIGYWVWAFTSSLALAGCSGGGDGGNEDSSGGNSQGGSSTAGSSSTGGSSGSSSTAGSSSTGGSAGTSAGLRGKGVGQPCETSDDCEDGLNCRLDETDYIAHKQCTASCFAEEECTDRFGEDTMCIGANICTLTCDTDADCPEKSVCSEFGWCSRSGPGSGVPYCGGTAMPCSLLSGTECLLALGCGDNSTCSGVATSCYSLTTSFSCTSQDGCFWSSSSEDCSGSASSCSLQSSEYFCTSQEGCSWQSACNGSATPCADLPLSLCTEQPGCSVIE
jgi:hypothetical protein